MVQPNSQYGNSIYFPYAAGCLTAYAFKDETVKNEYSFKGFIYKKEDIDKVVKTFENPFFVGFSCYVWNYEYNKKLAEKIKEKYPSCFIAFGGHQVNRESDVFSAEYVDFITLGEGEEAFKKLLLSLLGKEEKKNVPNLYYKENGLFLKSEAEINQIPDRVSVYLDGWFDDLVKNEELQFSAILETNRGCPNKCAFCDWGNIKSRVRHYDLDIVKKEIDWMAKNKIEYCYCADGNFGLFERDMEVVDYLIKTHAETGFPEKFQATYSKTNAETVFEINKRLNEEGICKGATLSFQSMCDEALKNIYRQNMPLESFLKLMTLYNKNNIPTYSELILGLPGETYESFKEGMEKLLECGQHMAINVFNCELLSNSIMNKPDYIRQFKIKSAKTEQHQYHVRPGDKDSVMEYSNIITETSTMPNSDWIQSNIFASFVRAFHNLGLLQCIAIYLYNEKKIKYKDFYCDIIDIAKKGENKYLSWVYNWLYNNYKKVSDGDGSLMSYDPAFGELTWPLDEFVFLKAVEIYDDFYEEITPIVKKYFDDEKLFDDIMKYQKAVVKNPYTKRTVLKMSYDFYDYFKNIYNNSPIKLLKKDNTIEIDTSEVADNLPDYAKITIWYGRKGGKNIASNISYK